MTTPADTAPSPPGPWAGADTVFDALEGAWDLDRTIENQATMRGIAVFERRDNGAYKYREEGRLRLIDGKAFDAHREYRFERTPEGFAVYFDEAPRLFHQIEIVRHGAGFAGSATHLCAPDTYDSSYRFAPDGSFAIQHTVHGPRKAYVSRTVFTRRATP